ncbi:DNA-binding response regulator [Labrys sp. (in: a-proteobacteria)]|uniref:response regulator transcription factor n=1 Tax=Labrys sp. (in: a-proteobacteria) TaxID=1917972 RepID=UPI0039E3F132
MKAESAAANTRENKFHRPPSYQRIILAETFSKKSRYKCDGTVEGVQSSIEVSGLGASRTFGLICRRKRQDGFKARMTLSPTEILIGVRVDEGRCLHALQAERTFDTYGLTQCRSAGTRTNIPPISIDLIGGCGLHRTALMRCLTASETALAVEGFKDVEVWASASLRANDVLLIASEHSPSIAAIGRDIGAILETAPAARILVLADVTTQAMLIALLKQGARGVVPSESTIDNVIFAARLVRRGGLFTPLLEADRRKSATPDPKEQEQPLQALLTPRQLEIVLELRKGSANKDIARELGMSEFTVRVHVRNILRRLKARSRTEVVARTNALQLQPARSCGMQEAPIGVHQAR